MTRFATLLVVALGTLLCVRPDAGEDLDSKLKHLEEDVALVKELMRLRGSDGAGAAKDQAPAKDKAPAKDQAPAKDKAAAKTVIPTQRPSQKAQNSAPAASETKKTQQSGTERYPPNNPRWNDLRSSVTFDAPADRTRLSIMSFKYNLEGEVSKYVDRVFGPHGLYYDDKMAKELGAVDFTEDEIKEAEARFAEAFKLKDEDKNLNPPCSVDMLGLWHPYLELGDPSLANSPGIKYKNDMEHSLKGSFALGEASMHLAGLVKGPAGEQSGKEDWKCYYRDLWKLDNRASAVFFYCPAKSKAHCEHLEAMATRKEDPNAFGWGRLKVNLELQSLVAREEGDKRTPWRMAFEAKINWRGRNLERDNTREFKRRAGMAVCTVVPYSTFDKEKARLNGVMMFEWTRYYLRQGYRVHIYDRDGTNAQYLFNQGMPGGWHDFLPAGEKGRKYHGGASTGNFDWDKLVYHNYTMLSVVDSTTDGVMYDNTEGVVPGEDLPAEAKKKGGPNAMGAEERKWLTDRDKSLTFTQCRMEVDAIWGIQDVLTVDFDEFLYCPEAPATPQDQYDFIHNKVNEERDKGIHSIQIYQRVPTNTTDLLPRECMLKVLENGDASIFECYGPYEAIVAAHSYKSLEMGHLCPVQNYHQGHNTDRGYRIYECGDRNYLNLDTKSCALLHLTTKPKDFESPCCSASEWNKEQKDKYRKKENSELWKVVHWNQ